jgi:ubiquinone/menaquinone biosynthesis C-methylase UbiE
MSFVDTAKDLLRPILPGRVRYLIRKILNLRLHKLSSVEYWTRHNVTEHRQFTSAEESRNFFDWRNAQYPGYIELVPVNQANDKVVLDYGCGPGNDLVGFSMHSRPKRLIGIDVSTSSLAEARKRLALHAAGNVELVHLSNPMGPLPFPDQSIDILHCSGVLMVLPDVEATLREFRRIIKPDGYSQIMVYNYDSIWMHLYCSYIYKKMFSWRSSLSKREIFKVTTDGEECPIVDCYTPDQFKAMAARAGFNCEFVGAAMSLNELQWMERRAEALKSELLDPEAREFLLNLTFDERQFPLHKGAVAGINACFRMTPV